jgi:hypothetical protein
MIKKSFISIKKTAKKNPCMSEGSQPRAAILGQNRRCLALLLWWKSYFLLSAVDMEWRASGMG